MSRQLIRVMFADVLLDLDGRPLKEVAQNTQQWLKQYGEDAMFYIGVDNFDSEYAWLMGYREETDDEYRIRLRKEVDFKKLTRKFARRV